MEATLPPLPVDAEESPVGLWQLFSRRLRALHVESRAERRLWAAVERGCRHWGAPLLAVDSTEELDERLDHTIRKPEFHDFNAHVSLLT